MLALAATLGGCALPQRAASPALYDFGRGTTMALPSAADGRLPVLAISVQATPTLEGGAMLYRLAYADDAQLRAYAQARWAMPPADLIQQRLREALGQHRVVVAPGEGARQALQLELEEFSQVFDAPDRSTGLLRLRATLRQVTPQGERQVVQRSVAVQRPAASPDAPGGVRALAAATDAAVAELAQWLLAETGGSRPARP
jgi:cholesterol transport system auxiliary component